MCNIKTIDAFWGFFFSQKEPWSAHDNVNLLKIHVEKNCPMINIAMGSLLLDITSDVTDSANVKTAVILEYNKLCPTLFYYQVILVFRKMRNIFMLCTKK